MVYIYLPAVYYHLNLDVTKGTLLAAGFPLSQRSFLFVSCMYCVYTLLCICGISFYYCAVCAHTMNVHI